MKLKVINDFLKDFHNQSSISSTIPVYIFNPSNLMSSHSALLQEHLSSKSFIKSVVLDSSSVSDSKTEFFTELFKGILGVEISGKMKISYDFSEFIEIFSEIKPSRDVIIILNNSSQLNLSHLDDFVRLWERKLKGSASQLKFIFDDSVSFLGMESRLRDRFAVIPFKCPSVKDVFNELVEEMIRLDLSVLLHPQLMKRFVGLSTNLPIFTIIKQIKFIIIAALSTTSNQSIPAINSSIQTIQTVSLSSVYLYLSGLSKRLKNVRQSSPSHSPARDFYSIIFDDILVESQVFNEIINELKSCSPNDFISIMSERTSDQKTLNTNTLYEFVDLNIVKALKDKIDSSSLTKTSLKDYQLDLIRKFSDFLLETKIEMPHGKTILKDERGNIRRAFEADPQFALQVALKFPSVYLNCHDCSTKGEKYNNSVNLVNSNTSTLSINTLMSSIHHNRSSMPDTCLLYRLSLEFCSKSINLLLWYKSFLSVIEAKKPGPLHAARFFKALNELQLIGMVSEFGRSKRKRKFVDRFNITDNLENEN